MSTIVILTRHEAAGPPPLVRFLPRFVGQESERRCISMISDIHGWIHKPAKTRRIQELKAAVRAHFGVFVKEEPIDDFHFMKQIEDRRGGPKFSHGVWSVRPKFEPQHRFFGVFARPDWLVVLHKQLRSNLDTDARWHAALDRTLEKWALLFPSIPVYTGTELKHYVANNASHNDARWY
jgi:hypothetical protein